MDTTIIILIIVICLSISSSIGIGGGGAYFYSSSLTKAKAEKEAKEKAAADKAAAEKAKKIAAEKAKKAKKQKEAADARAALETAASVTSAIPPAVTPITTVIDTQSLPAGPTDVNLEDWVEVEDADYPDNDIKCYGLDNPSKKVQECGNLCDKDNKCVGFVDIPEGSIWGDTKKGCCLKNKLEAKVTAKNAKFYIKPGNEEPTESNLSRYTKLENVDYQGNDIKCMESKDLTEQDLANMCKAKSDCVGFVYIPTSNGKFKGCIKNKMERYVPIDGAFYVVEGKTPPPRPFEVNAYEGNNDEWRNFAKDINFPEGNRDSFKMTPCISNKSAIERGYTWRDDAGVGSCNMAGYDGWNRALYCDKQGGEDRYKYVCRRKDRKWLNTYETDSRGGGGGGYRELICPDGSYVSQFYGRKGNEIDKIGVKCTNRDDRGAHGGGGGGYWETNWRNDGFTKVEVKGDNKVNHLKFFGGKNREEVFRTGDNDWAPTVMDCGNFGGRVKGVKVWTGDRVDRLQVVCGNED